MPIYKQYVALCAYICTYILTSNTHTRRIGLFVIHENKIDTRPNPPLHIEWDGQRGWPHCFSKWKGIAFLLLCVNGLDTLSEGGQQHNPLSHPTFTIPSSRDTDCRQASRRNMMCVFSFFLKQSIPESNYLIINNLTISQAIYIRI